MKFVKCFLALAVLTSSAVGCMSTGQQFQASNIANLTPGETTLDEASRILAGPPANVFAQKDGTSLVLWAFSNTLVTDAVYLRKEALLQFGPDRKLMRLVDSTNIRLSDEQRRKLLGPAPVTMQKELVQPVVTTPAPATASEMIRIDPPAASKPVKASALKKKPVKKAPAPKTTPAPGKATPCTC